MIDHESSPTRVAAQVVSGIGFLGAGVIMREGLNVRGLATAATLWCSAAVGVLAGSGRLIEAGVGTAGVLVVHLILRPVVRRIDARVKVATGVETQYRARVVCQRSDAILIRTIFMRHVNSEAAMSVQGISLEDVEGGECTAVVADIYSAERKDKFMNDLISRMGIEPSVTSASWEKA